MGRKLGSIGKKLSLDHHSQGLLFMLGLILLAAQAWWALLGLFLYGIMHFQYCGGGTFQRAVRDEDQQDSLVDLLYIFIGIGGLLLMLVRLCLFISRL